MNDRKKVIRLAAVLAALALIYIMLITVCPKLSVWSFPKRYNYSSEAVRTPLKEGDSFEQSFVIEFERLNGVDLYMSGAGSDNVVSMDALLEITDGDGNVIASKKITSAYDSTLSTGYKDVLQWGTYKLKLTVNDVGGGKTPSIAPEVLVNPADGSLIFEVRGTGSGSADKLPFTLIYVIFSVMVLLFTWFCDRKKIGDARYPDIAILGVLVLFSLFLVSQYYDLFMIIKSALRMIDSFKSGNFTDYYGYSYTSELVNQSNKMLFAYEYNFFQIFLTAILILPLSFFYNGELYGGGMDGLIAVTYLSIVMTVLVFVAYKLLIRAIRSCDMSDDYKKSAGALFIFSPMLIYMIIAYGQIDIMYIIVILLALPFYYNRKYILFSLIMSVAVAMKTLPILIFIPLILLACKKIKDIALNMLIVLVFPVLTKLVFEGSSGHKAISAIIEEDYSYVERIAEVRIGDVISVFILVFALICIACYVIKTDTEDKKKMLFTSQLAVFAVYGAFAIFVDWHQQWMIPLVIAVSLLIPFFKFDSKVLLLEIALEALYLLAADIRGASLYKINFGLLPQITGEYGDSPEMATIINNISSIAPVAVRTCLAAVITGLAVYFFRSRNNTVPDGKDTAIDRSLVVGRAGVLYLFILFYCWAFTYIG